MSWPSSLLSWLVGLGSGEYKVSQEWKFCWTEIGFLCVVSGCPSFSGEKRGHQEGLTVYLVIISALEESWLIQKGLAKLAFGFGVLVF